MIGWPKDYTTKVVRVSNRECVKADVDRILAGTKATANDDLTSLEGDGVGTPRGGDPIKSE